jgi:hypothetical protein
MVRPRPSRSTRSQGTPTRSGVAPETTNNRRAFAWGIGIGVAQVAATSGFWWLDLSTVHALMIVLIAAVYVGFAVSDGRTNVFAVESAIVAVFFLAAAIALAVSPWLIVGTYLGHAAKDLWQHRTQFVRDTRWWPPFCLAVDITAAGITAALILLETRFQA